MYKQETVTRTDSPDAEAIAASEAAAATVRNKALAIYFLTAFVLNWLVIIFMRLAHKATGLSEWIIAPLAIASALSLYVFVSKWLFPPKKS